MRRLKTTEVAKVREAIRLRRGSICPLCKRKMKASMATLDHCHVSGAIRDVLCRNCNGIEGRVNNLIKRAKAALDSEEWLSNLAEYRLRHRVSQWKLVHPTHKTEAEKRAARNLKARQRRAAKKKGKKK